MSTERILTRIEQIKAAGNYNWNAIAQTIAQEYHKVFTSGEACRSWYRRNSSVPRETPTQHKTPQIPQSVPKPFDAILELPNATTLVFADLHCPYHDAEYLETAVDIAKNSVYAIEQIIIAGDLLDLDSLSRYSKAYNIARLETELEVTGKMLLWLSDIAPVFITHGNHEARFFDKLDTPLSFQRLISAALNGRQPKHDIVTTERDYLFVGDHFVVGHLDKGSSMPGKLAHGIAQKYKRHALVGHDHITGIFRGNPTATYLGASIGCCADPTKFWYSERRLNSMPFMTKGYALLDGNADSFSLHDAQHNVYFQRTRMNDGVYNCFKV